MTTTTHELDADRLRVLTRLAEVNAQIAELTGQAESLKAELRHLEPGDYNHNGRTALRIIPNRRFDAHAAALRLPEDKRAECLKVDYDPAKVKQYLTPVEVEEFMVEVGKPKVVLP